MDKKVIVARANQAIGNKKVFYKTYVKNVFLVEVREIPEHIMGWVEEDYIFNYKGEVYRLNQHIKPNVQGVIKYSADYYYTLEMLKRRLVKVAYKISQLPERKGTNEG